jgi:FkbM family methyltransferase
MVNFDYYKKSLQYMFERLADRRGFLFETSQHGVEDVLDMARWIVPGEVILDVGANVGQTAIRLRAAFPSARIISFEPIAATFATLQKRTQGLGIEVHKLALGSEAKTQTMFLTPFSLTNSLVRPPQDQLLGMEQVEVATLDHFVRENKIERIGLLKIDAEGFDLEVVRGALDTLASGAVRFVLAEVGFHRGDDRHPLFDDVRDALTPFGFRVFGIYKQNLEWTGEPSLLFANALFCRGADAKATAIK